MLTHKNANKLSFFRTLKVLQIQYIVCGIILALAFEKIFVEKKTGSSGESTALDTSY